MSYTNKTLEQLNVMDDFLMNAVTANPDVGEHFCRTVLSVLLQRKIEKIRIVSQRAIPAMIPGLRGIRMDVEIEEFGEETDMPVNVYDLEPHLQKGIHLPRHNRFYQAKIDGRSMKSGETDFLKLPNLYVLTITNYDPFGYDYMMYRIRNRCEEVPQLQYDDGLEFIYFYTGGQKGGNESIKAMLNYLEHSVEENAVDDATKEVHRFVGQVKVLPEVRMEYMTFEDYIYYERLEAAEEATRDTQVNCIIDLLSEYGDVPEALKEQLSETNDINKLKAWLKLAARVNDIQEFADKINAE